ncbi:DapH/DapD/GlmU-related protein [Clostridium tagluense]|uniref:Putative lipopolysaccharide biosynthesis O-acetyl transferase WbbJ n=1 Tax=Clostridium tagluense TaxID=360422 RepID=A0A401UJJ9_9CLOT|nr:DapH/DapD/GlmU-related protein [Clostridium tagluense]GCD09733.1 putative lipopolysaccharide biosynthesis O-acetyl transferase WbbJ [Clostridium tagluense]
MKNGYGLGEIFKNAIALFYTKIFYKGARLIRRPIYVRGKKFLQYGEGLTTGYGCRLEMFDTGVGEVKKLVIGKNCKLGDNVHIAAGENVTIGDNCLMASKVYISDVNHGDYSGIVEYSSPDISPDNRQLYTRTVSIGNNVWIGENVCILPGVTIGDGCIIGANSVVNRGVLNNCMIAGSPARVIKKYDDKARQWRKFNE